MATITTEYGKLSSNKTRTVYLRIRSGKTEKRINTQVKVLESEISPRTKKITYTLLKEFENHLSKKPRAQSLYLGELRHLFREAMLEFNTEEKTIIKSDPFIRYKVPRQVMKKGVRTLTLEELIKVYHYQGKPGSRAQLARDTFILSFCLMGMNSMDLFSATNYKNGFIKYNRTKTKDRRNDEALNHVSSFEVADIYIAKDFSIINDNNFKLIKRVFKKELA